MLDGLLQILGDANSEIRRKLVNSLLLLSLTSQSPFYYCHNNTSYPVFAVAVSLNTCFPVHRPSDASWLILPFSSIDFSGRKKACARKAFDNLTRRTLNQISLYKIWCEHIRAGVDRCFWPFCDRVSTPGQDLYPRLHCSKATA